MSDNPANQGQDEDVDQFFDDGGETFLPADHVCNPQVFYSLAPHGAPLKCLDQATHRRARAHRSAASREGRGS